MENIPNQAEQKLNVADRLPIGERNRFQRHIFEKLGINKNVERVLIDGKIISDYIDNPQNEEVRNLIMQGNFEEASKIVIAEIQEKEHLQQVA